MLRSTFPQPLFFSGIRNRHLVRPHKRTFHTPTVCRNAPSAAHPTSVYVHLPFCRKRCHYCDFPIVALGTTPTAHDGGGGGGNDDPRISNYISLLLREIHSTARPAEHTSDSPLRTVYFGGGTPSLVPPRVVAGILDALRSKFGIQHDAEISMEMDPGTFDAGKLGELLSLGVNRVSLGVQAFQEELLRGCGRAHGVREVYDAIEVVVGASGLVNWSMDLISSLPHQSLAMWEESLRLAVDARPTHLSVYDLQVEQGTKFGRLYTPGEFPLPTENQSADFYKAAASTLSRAGYEHYEISSYSKEGFQSEHNLVYWENRPFYAFGLGAASYIDGTRFSRPRKIREYAKYVQQLEDGTLEKDDSGDSGAGDLAMDVVMLSLRTASGLDFKSFTERFGRGLGASLCEVFEPYFESGHVVALDENRRPLQGPEEDCRDIAFIRLSDPDGFLLSNELISAAFRVISP